MCISFCFIFRIVSLVFLVIENLGAVGGGDDDGGEDNKEKAEEEERERLEAIREAEERRKEKHRKMEEEREKMRQDIRDKVNIFAIFIQFQTSILDLIYFCRIFTDCRKIMHKHGNAHTLAHNFYSTIAMKRAFCTRLIYRCIAFELSVDSDG